MSRTTAKPILVGVLSLVGVFALAACDNAPAGNNTGVAGIDKFNNAGPENVRRVSVNGFTAFLGNGGGAKPALTWANGTGGSPGTYADILTRVASFGTQVIASNSPNTGTGTEVADGVGVLGNMTSLNGDFCTSGHSQGGSGCINAARIITQRGTANVRCTIPVEPDTVFTASSDGRDIRGLGLILCGSNDTLAPCDISAGNNGNGLFGESRVPTTQITVTGAGHVGTGSPAGADAGLFPALVTAGVEAAIGGDAQARAAVFAANPGAANGRGLQMVRSKGF